MYSACRCAKVCILCAVYLYVHTEYIPYINTIHSPAVGAKRSGESCTSCHPLRWPPFPLQLCLHRLARASQLQLSITSPHSEALFRRRGRLIQHAMLTTAEPSPIWCPP